jgi:hypothetical protein
MSLAQHLYDSLFTGIDCVLSLANEKQRSRWVAGVARVAGVATVAAVAGIARLIVVTGVVEVAGVGAGLQG